MIQYLYFIEYDHCISLSYTHFVWWDHCQIKLVPKSSGHATCLASAERAPKCARVWDFGLRTIRETSKLVEDISSSSSQGEVSKSELLKLADLPTFFCIFNMPHRNFWDFSRELRQRVQHAKDSIPIWIWGLLRRVKSFYDNIFVTWHEKNGGCSFVGWN